MVTKEQSMAARRKPISASPVGAENESIAVQRKAGSADQVEANRVAQYERMAFLREIKLQVRARRDRIDPQRQRDVRVWMVRRNERRTASAARREARLANRVEAGKATNHVEARSADQVEADKESARERRSLEQKARIDLNVEAYLFTQHERRAIQREVRSARSPDQVEGDMVANNKRIAARTPDQV
jgi:hypothetical protein